MTIHVKHGSSILAALALGCAGAGEESLHELGSAEQLGEHTAAFTASFTNTFQLGTQTNASKLQCDRVSLGQTCVIPGGRFLTWCVDSATSEFSAAQRTTIREVFSEFGEGLGNVGWTLLEVDPFDDGVCRNFTNIKVSEGVVSGTLSNNIDGYSDVTFSSPTDLTEGFGGDAPPVGQYQRYRQCFGTIDMVDINNKGASADEDRNILRHAAGHAVLACTGFGTQTSAATPFFARRALMPDETGLPLTVGQQCIASTFEPNNNTDFSLTFSNCSTD
jgi:hypothetical protein